MHKSYCRLTSGPWSVLRHFPPTSKAGRKRREGVAVLRGLVASMAAAVRTAPPLGVDPATVIKECGHRQLSTSASNLQYFIRVLKDNNTISTTTLNSKSLLVRPLNSSPAPSDLTTGFGCNLLCRRLVSQLCDAIGGPMDRTTGRYPRGIVACSEQRRGSGPSEAHSIPDTVTGPRAVGSRGCKEAGGGGRPVCVQRAKRSSSCASTSVPGCTPTRVGVV